METARHDLEPTVTSLAAIQAASNGQQRLEGIMRLKLLLLSSIPLIWTQTQLLDYGERAGDQSLDFSDGQHAVAIDVPMVYMETPYSELYISPNGIVGFGERLPDGVAPLQKLNRSAIATFYAPASEGIIYYRSTSSDQRLLRRLTDYIHKTFADSSDFQTLQAMIVTWDGIQNKEQDGGATFQLALASDGMITYALMQFLKLPWSASGGIYAQSGFTMPDGRYQSNTNSGGPDVKELVGLSNNPEGTSFIFRVSGSAIEDPRENAEDYEYTNYDQTDYDGDERKPPADCPVDPYSDRCPDGCNILTDERMCSKCVCAEPPADDVEGVTEEAVQRLPKPAHPLRPETAEEKGAHREGHDKRNEEEERRREHERQQHQQQLEERRREYERQLQEQERRREHERQQVEQQQREHGDESVHEQQEAERREHERKMQQQRAEEESGQQQKPTPTTCAAAGEEACNVNAGCRDYAGGFCCECRTGYYGNGKECLKKGDPQRISGSFEGVINGMSIPRTDLHTFITGTDGNAYTAVSKIPSDLGSPFLLLNPIGSIMGWLFADVQSSTAYNGFQLTGGLFNRTVTLHIGDRYQVSIRQKFSGRDIYHYFKATVFVSGTLPDIAPGAEVQFPDYEEEYRREKPGVVRSYTGMDIILREGGETKTIRMTVDQLIQFDECPHRTFDKDNNVVLHVKRVHVTYDASEGIVRYGSRNYAKPGSVSSTNREQIQPAQHSHFDRRQHGQAQQQAQNPVELNRDLCAEGRHVCTLPNMRCRPVDPSYRCECLPGYQAKRNESSPLGWNCQDLNECERGDHTCDHYAVCHNTDGSFTCQCRPGYTGDGHHCSTFHGDETSMESGFTTMDAIELTLPRGEPEQQPQSQHPKGTCTNHQQCHQWGECAFVDGSPHGQCKCRGWYVGDGVDHCGPPQEQRHEEPRLNANIPMRGGQPCGQHVCDVNAECMPSPSGGSECVCKAGYHGNGISCESLSDDEEEVKTQVPEETVGKVCRAHEECSEHGSCSYSRTLGYYHCTCTKPYVGNGVECTLKHEGAQEREEQQGCDRLRNCDQNAQCVYDSHNRIYRCECYEGYAGDGKTCVQIHTGRQQWEGGEKQPQQCRDSTDCHQNGHCVVAGTQGYICECLPGYRGDGVRQCAVADQCNPTDRSSCHQNAECVYGEAERAYVCKCVRGFTGDGVRCVPHARPQTCREEPRLCHANAQCVYNHNENTFICVCKPGAVGDGYQKCDIQETPRCSNCSTHAHCSQTHAGGWQCKCNAGYQGNGHVCAAMTSCLDDRSLCDPHAECVPGEGGHYVCNCLYGYRGNGRTCTPDSQPRDETLLVSRGMAIFQRGVNPETPGKQLIVIPHHIAVGLDYDCKEDRIIWSDISGHSIRSASLNGTDHKSFYAADLNSPEGVAVDWSSRNVYYADSLKDEIGVASLDGKYQKALVTEGLVNPRALALDLHNRHLYYTDWHRENPVIGRVDMDGQNNRIFLNDDIHLPNGIAILPNRRELCWVDAGNHRLSCIGLDGNNRRVVFAPLQHPFGLTHNNEARFYWTDWKDNRIHSVGIYGDGYASFPISLGGSGKVYGILSVPKHCTGPNTACSVNNGGCPYLCLPGQEEVRCECPSNVAVKGC
ncbi:hypothetical protein RB195_014916 [Necator americanus]|uniref:EGF-like domain protein n=1 Tax=Necator americanus TaxID=51031 RepID=A0ABR1E255_NECAM